MVFDQPFAAAVVGVGLHRGVQSIGVHPVPPIGPNRLHLNDPDVGMVRPEDESQGVLVDSAKQAVLGMRPPLQVRVVLQFGFQQQTGIVVLLSFRRRTLPKRSAARSDVARSEKRMSKRRIAPPAIHSADEGSRFLMPDFSRM